MQLGTQKPITLRPHDIALAHAAQTAHVKLGLEQGNKHKKVPAFDKHNVMCHFQASKEQAFQLVDFNIKIYKFNLQNRGVRLTHRFHLLV